MEQIKILKLNSSEYIVCYCEKNENEIIVRDPLLVDLHTDFRTGKQSISMSQWLPVPLIETNQVTIDITDILYSVEPNAEFMEYYENAILNSKRRKEDSLSSSEDILTTQDMKLILESITLEGNQVH